MSWKKNLAAYTTFSRKDRAGILTLFCLILAIIFIPEFFSKTPDTLSLKADSSFSKALKTKPENRTTKQKEIVSQYNDRISSPAYYHEPDYNENASLFAFDPNTLNENGWKSLGLQDKTIRTIINYRQKGGRFYRRDDLKKIWGLPAGFYERIESYIELPSTVQSSFKHTVYPEKGERKIIAIDINNADTSAFISLPGIGSRLANRIVTFREKLGGFYSVDQIRETYGLPDSTFQMIKEYLQMSEYPLRRLNLNTATKDELKTHPYIRWNLANAIVEYRNQHGNYNSLDDLNKIALIDEPTFKKIQPYLSL